MSKNGELVSNLYQQEKADKAAGHKGHHEKLTKLDIPALNIHKQFVDDDNEDQDMTNMVKRNVS